MVRVKSRTLTKGNYHLILGGWGARMKFEIKKNNFQDKKDGTCHE